MTLAVVTQVAAEGAVHELFLRNTLHSGLLAFCQLLRIIVERHNTRLSAKHWDAACQSYMPSAL